MSGGGGDAPHPPAANGGEFLLSLLHKQATPSQHSPFLSGDAAVRQPHQHQQQPLLPDPAVAAVGRTLPDAPTWPLSNGVDLPHNFPHSISPAFASNLPGFPQNSWPPLGDQFNANQRDRSDDLARLGLSMVDANVPIQILMQQKQLEQRLVHGLSLGEARTPERVVDGNLFENPKYDVSKGRELRNGSTTSNVFYRDHQFDSPVTSNSNAYAFQHEVSGDRGRTHPHRGNFRQVATGDTRGPPPGFPGRPRGGANLDLRNKGSYEYIAVDKERSGPSRSGNSRVSHADGKVRSSSDVRLTEQLDHPGPSTGSRLHSVPAVEVEDAFMDLHSSESGGKVSGRDILTREHVLEIDETGEELIGSLTIEDETDEKNEKKRPQNPRDKEFRKDSRGRWIMNQRMRNFKTFTECRRDIGLLNAPFLALYESLIPQEEEKVRQKELLDLLEKLVTKEWPQARLYLYGSCANSFGVSKSDIDVCMAIGDVDINKSEVLLKLADILQSDNLQNVQALTRARVPIVKLMDPATGISCDICINNILAVVNTKLLRDYAQIDVRLRQLAFIVKHWAKCRRVNETYQGTLSSYAYVLMCIHFLQQRRPAILPCLQGMETTYTVTVDDVNCSFFDQVEKLRNFGSQNKEAIAQLVWGFFKYWAYVHDYANSVISVRTGSIISKQDKLWTRRVGNDRHLICIEDPFETEHDLGRVVDKFSIRVLREEFERAAEIMQHDHNPCVTLFQPYLPTSQTVSRLLT